MLELMLESQPPGRLWFVGRTPAGKAQDAINIAVRTLMLLVPLTCCRTQGGNSGERQ
jgi:hypothetical protein